MFDTVWPMLDGLGGATAAEVWPLFASGCAQLWVALAGGNVRAAALTQSGPTDLHLWLCVGGGCDWRDLIEQMAALARNRFDWLTIDGRKGWARVLGDDFSSRADGLLARRLKGTRVHRVLTLSPAAA